MYSQIQVIENNENVLKLNYIYLLLRYFQVHYFESSKVYNNGVKS